MCSVALARDGVLLAYLDAEEENIHGSALTGFISDVLKSAGCQIGDLDAVAVSCGPGSYTGLRIGLATAKGICFGADIPLIAVETLESMAAGFILQNPLLVASNEIKKNLVAPMIDARREEVYTALYSEDGQLISPVAAVILDSKLFADYLCETSILCFGNGANKVSNVVELDQNIKVKNGFSCSAVHMITLSHEAHTQEKFCDLAYFEPHYLKEFYHPKAAIK